VNPEEKEYLAKFCASKDLEKVHCLKKKEEKKKKKKDKRWASLEGAAKPFTVLASLP
jgi:hypothetical protein